MLNYLYYDRQFIASISINSRLITLSTLPQTAPRQVRATGTELIFSLDVVAAHNFKGYFTCDDAHRAAFHHPGCNWAFNYAHAAGNWRICRLAETHHLPRICARVENIVSRRGAASGVSLRGDCPCVWIWCARCMLIMYHVCKRGVPAPRADTSHESLMLNWFFNQTGLFQLRYKLDGSSLRCKSIIDTQYIVSNLHFRCYCYCRRSDY